MLWDAEVMLWDAEVMLWDAEVMLRDTKVMLRDTKVMLRDTKVMLRDTKVILRDVGLILRDTYRISRFHHGEDFSCGDHVGRSRRQRMQREGFMLPRSARAKTTGTRVARLVDAHCSAPFAKLGRPQ